MKLVNHQTGKRILPLLFVCVSAVIQVSDTTAGNISFTLENDLFGSAGTDRYYTNGLNITVIDEGSPVWLKALARAGYQHGRNSSNRQRVSYTGGQDIYTPQNIEEQELIKDDRPYAGWLYLGMGIHNRSPSGRGDDAGNIFQWHTQESTEVILGIIGPQSYAGEIQYWWHDHVIGFNRTTKPSGWDNQLNNELAFAFFRERKWRIRGTIAEQTGLQIDLIPHMAIALGTVTTYAAAGAEARLGWNLPDDFGSAKHRAGLSPSRIAAPFWQQKGGSKKLQPISFHLFGKVEGRAVFRDIFLDGNTFADSHCVDREPTVFSVVTGAGLLLWNHIELIFSHVYQSKEFEGQPLSHVYGALTLSGYW